MKRWRAGSSDGGSRTPRSAPRVCGVARVRDAVYRPLGRRKEPELRLLLSAAVMRLPRGRPTARGAVGKHLARKSPELGPLIAHLLAWSYSEHRCLVKPQAIDKRRSSERIDPGAVFPIRRE